jgi:hypothetical protein
VFWAVLLKQHLHLHERQRDSSHLTWLGDAGLSVQTPPATPVLPLIIASMHTSAQQRITRQIDPEARLTCSARLRTRETGKMPVLTHSLSFECDVCVLSSYLLENYILPFSDKVSKAKPCRIRRVLQSRRFAPKSVSSRLRSTRLCEKTVENVGGRTHEGRSSEKSQDGKQILMSCVCVCVCQHSAPSLSGKRSHWNISVVMTVMTLREACVALE